jgi:DNA invertase Pin-like site-specific DNA recombinase
MALIGYARVSTHEQNLHLQQDALTAAGSLKIFTDTISGTKLDRMGLTEALDFIRGGDTLVVWRLDRLVLLCQILSEHSSLNCSVVIHHNTAW